MPTKRQALDTALREDLYAMFQKTFATLAPGQKFLPNWHLRAIAHQLMRCERGEIKRLIINIQPRSGKSLMTSVAFAAWVMGRNPTAQVACASYSQNLSQSHHLNFRCIIEQPWYRDAFPGMRIDKRKNTEDEVMTTRHGRRLATSVGGTFLGRGADFIILDDPQMPEGVLSDAERPKAAAWFDSTAVTRLNNPSAGVIIVVTQRLHMDDLTAHLLEQGGWELLSLPAVTDFDREVAIGPNQVYHWPAGEALHPTRYPLEKLNEEKAKSLGAQAAMWSAMFLQRPVPPGGALIEREWFSTYNDPPQPQPGDMIVQSWDTAYKAGVRNNYSACLTFLCREDQYYLLDVYRGRLEFLALKHKIRQLAEQFLANNVLVEEAALGAALIAALREETTIDPIAVKPQGSKEDRVIRQTAPLAGGRVWLPKRSVWLPDFLDEVLPFPGSAFDDQVDALSQFLEWIEERRRIAKMQTIQLGIYYESNPDPGPFGPPKPFTLDERNAWMAPPRFGHF